MDGEPLRCVPSGVVDFEVAPGHHELCEHLFHEELQRQLRQDLRRSIETEIVRMRRLELTLQAERDQALRGREIRTKADVLAANLHRVRPGQAVIELEDFQGRALRVELDPARSPSQNLDSLYRQAARADRKLSVVEQRLEASAQACRESLRKKERLEECRDTNALSELALELGMELNRPRTETQRRRRAQQERRLPYWTFRCEGWELRVGRSARDNDLLIAHHCKGQDLWLHAQGVAGSHAVLRSGGRPVPRRILEEAARIAAHYSKSRTSSTVPVVFTQRRYVRKPRHAPAGEVRVERGQTIFVEPGIPSRWHDET
jgi:predicted ribosome quality control (RQC) complex YloA/Tae2 family protein